MSHTLLTLNRLLASSIFCLHSGFVDFLLFFWYRTISHTFTLSPSLFSISLTHLASNILTRYHSYNLSNTFSHPHRTTHIAMAQTPFCVNSLSLSLSHSLFLFLTVSATLNYLFSQTSLTFSKQEQDIQFMVTLDHSKSVWNLSLTFWGLFHKTLRIHKLPILIVAKLWP